MIKFRNIIKDKNLKSRINVLIDDAKKNFGRSLGKNDFYHSEKVEEKLDMLIPDHIKRDKKIFGEHEILYLLYGVYLHDIGRSVDSNHHEKETYNQILKEPSKYGLKNEFEGKAVAEICYGHAKESERKIKDIPTNYRVEGIDKPLDLQFLAALLRLADELDNDFIRVQGVIDQKNSIRHIIRSVSINAQDFTIRIQTDAIRNKDKEELQRIRDLMQDRLREIRDILRPKGLFYDSIEIEIEKIIEDKEEELEKELYNLILDNKDVPYFKIMSNKGDCILFGDNLGFSDDAYYFYSHDFVIIEKLENILKTYHENLIKDYQFNYPSFLINQICKKHNIHISWFGYGYKNFIRALKERNERYADAGIVEPHHSESAGFIVDGTDHIFYIAVLAELHRQNWFEIDVGFVFEKMLFDNKKYIEFYEKIGLELPNFYEKQKNRLLEPIDLREYDVELKTEGFLKYNFEKKEFWISKIICNNPFYKTDINDDMNRHDKIVVNLRNHHPFNVAKSYHLYEGRIIEIPYGVFNFHILNIRGDWND